MRFKALIIIILLSSCTAQKRCERKLRKAEKLGCLTYSNDTIILTDTIKGENVLIEIPVSPDSLQLEKELAKIKDTCISKKKIREVFTQIPCKVKPFEKDTSNYKIKIWVENGLIKFNLKIKDKIIRTKVITKTKVVKLRPKWNKYIEWVIFFALAFLVFKAIEKK